MNTGVIDGAIFTEAEELLRSDEISIDNVVGLENLKLQLKLIKELIENESSATNYALQPSNGFIFEGKPGCGKTLFGKIFAKQLKYNLLYVSASEFHSAVPGIGKNKIKKIFDNARLQAPCILFIDEIDSITNKRESVRENEVGVLQQMLVELDLIQDDDSVIVICATNVLNNLDPAFKRSGRFDMIFTFDVPNSEQRTEMFITKMQNIVNKTSEIDSKTLGEITEGFSYADIDAVIKIAKERSFLEKSMLSDKHLINAIKIVKVGETSNEVKIDKKSREYWVNHVSGHILAYIYAPSLFVFAHTKVGNTIKCNPTHAGKLVYDIDDIVIQLLSIYCAKSTNFSKTGASTNLYVDHDSHKASTLIKKALLMLGVTQVDEEKFIIIQEAIHTLLTKFSKELLEKYKDGFDEIKKLLLMQGYITKADLRKVIKQKVHTHTKQEELYMELKKLIGQLFCNARKSYVYLDDPKK